MTSLPKKIHLHRTGLPPSHRPNIDTTPHHTTYHHKKRSFQSTNLPKNALENGEQTQSTMEIDPICDQECIKNVTP